MIQSIFKIFLAALIALPISAQQITESMILGHNSFKQGELSQALSYYLLHSRQEVSHFDNLSIYLVNL